MNKKRRTAIKSYINALKSYQTLFSEMAGAFQEIADGIYGIENEQQQAYDNLPQSLQQSDKGQSMLQYIDRLQSAYNAIQNTDSDIQNALSSVEQAIDQLSEIE